VFYFDDTYALTDDSVVLNKGNNRYVYNTPVEIEGIKYLTDSSKKFSIPDFPYYMKPENKRQIISKIEEEPLIERSFTSGRADQGLLFESKVTTNFESILKDSNRVDSSLKRSTKRAIIHVYQEDCQGGVFKGNLVFNLAWGRFIRLSLNFNNWFPVEDFVMNPSLTEDEQDYFELCFLSKILGITITNTGVVITTNKEPFVITPEFRLSHLQKDIEFDGVYKAIMRVELSHYLAGTTRSLFSSTGNETIYPGNFIILETKLASDWSVEKAFKQLPRNSQLLRLGAKVFYLLIFSPGKSMVQNDWEILYNKMKSQNDHIELFVYQLTDDEKEFLLPGDQTGVRNFLNEFGEQLNKQMKTMKEEIKIEIGEQLNKQMKTMKEEINIEIGEQLNKQMKTMKEEINIEFGEQLNKQMKTMKEENNIQYSTLIDELKKINLRLDGQTD
jgi:uncharacterized FlaG/YvyC family protein